MGGRVAPVARHHLYPVGVRHQRLLARCFSIYTVASATRNRRASSVRRCLLTPGDLWSIVRNSAKLYTKSSIGVSDVTVAVRGPPSKRAISPKKSPERNLALVAP